MKPEDIKIDPELRDMLVPLTEEEEKSLKGSLLLYGCLQALIVDEKTGVLVDGHNRYRICKANNIPFAVKTLILGSRENIENWIIRNQIGRRNLSQERMEVYIARIYKHAKKPKGFQEGNEANKSGVNQHSRTRGHNDPVSSDSSHKAAKDVGEKVGKSERQVRRIEKKIDAIEKAGKLAEYEQGKLSKKEIKRIIERENDESKKAPKVEYLVKYEDSAFSDINDIVNLGVKFGTIYADPPWRYNNQGTRAATDNHYDGTMSVDELCALPIKEITANQAHLHLWVTNAFLFEVPKIFEVWGFEYKSTFVWVKPQMGIGNYWRNSHELMILGVKGGLTAAAKNQMSWIECRRGEHSAKPQQVREAVEKLSPGPRLELFGRKMIENWVVFGNQIQKELL